MIGPSTQSYIPRILDRMEDKPRLARKLSNPKTWTKEGERLKFDAVVGNPPYQMMDGGNRNSSTPIYQLFVSQAKELRPQYISMITPSRWFAGGKGLDEFRAEMLTDSHIRKIVDFPDSTECFTGADIAGGVNFFLWDQGHDGICEVVSVHGGEIISKHRALNEYDIFIRNNGSIN